MVSVVHPSRVSARRLVLDGRVQGVGFRPFVYRLALAHGLHGWVYNDAGSVYVQAEGNDEALDRFTAELIRDAPPLAQPHLISSEAVTPEAHTDFTIRHSHADSEPRIHIPPDYYLCDDCLAELRDRAIRSSTARNVVRVTQSSGPCPMIAPTLPWWISRFARPARPNT